ncbi:hypothetical protein AB2T85_03055 [Clostridium butyricum]|uniref:hypothetical protein n=1 Tax=Clostridium butyricum TaxID=1492 RepID=UPI003466389C
MALKGNILVKGVIPINDAYLKIYTYSGNKESITAILGVYFNSVMIDTIEFNFIPEVKDSAPILEKQIYRKVKENTLYSNLEDILEEGQTP